MAKIDFSKIAEMLNSSTDFSLTEKQYYNLTRSNLPKDTNYLLNKSALARFSKEKDFDAARRLVCRIRCFSHRLRA